MRSPSGTHLRFPRSCAKLAPVDHARGSNSPSLDDTARNVTHAENRGFVGVSGGSVDAPGSGSVWPAPGRIAAVDRRLLASRTIQPRASGAGGDDQNRDRDQRPECVLTPRPSQVATQCVRDRTGHAARHARPSGHQTERAQHRPAPPAEGERRKDIAHSDHRPVAHR
jgi:hypothetical protein